MSKLWAELMPGLSGVDFTGEFTGRANRQALERATAVSVYSNAVGNIEVSPDDEPGTWYDTGEDAVVGLYTMVKVPVGRAIRVAGIVAATPAPVRIQVRHDM